MHCMADIHTQRLRRSVAFAHGALVEPNSSERIEVERFIADVYRHQYDAQLRSFMPQLLAYRDGQGQLVAAVGLRFGIEGRLFTEQYLDVAAETAMSTRLHRPVQRAELVEVGNFAATSPGTARELIVQMTQTLHGAGIRWVLFAATRQLRNAFDRLRLDTVELAEARADRLTDDADDWGRYYDTQPLLMCGDVAAGQAFLAQPERQTRGPLVFGRWGDVAMNGVACA